MADILIKNMEMPRNCVECFCMNTCDAHAIMMGELLREGCENFMAEFRKGRLDGCPLVEVKKVKFKNSDDALKIYADEKKIWTEASE